MLELLLHAGVRSLRGEGPDVELVDRRLMPGPSLPGIRLPSERRGIYELARPLGVLRLEARGGVGNPLRAVDAVAIGHARARLRLDALEPAFVLALEGAKLVAELELHVPRR